MSNIEIITNVPALAVSRVRKYARMKFRLILGQLAGDYYPVKVMDFYEEISEQEVNEVNENGEIVPIVKNISTWHLLPEVSIQIEKKKFDLLYNSVRDEIPEGLSYSDRQTAELRLGFLRYVQNDPIPTGNCIYDLKPENFEIYEDDN